MEFSPEEVRIDAALRERLSEFPLYREDHYAGVFIRNDMVYIGYSSVKERVKSRDSTGFDLQVDGKECDILHFDIEYGKRKQGFGTKLYRIIEEFCKNEFGCNSFVTSPSGQGIGFWFKQGFVEDIGGLKGKRLRV